MSLIWALWSSLSPLLHCFSSLGSVTAWLRDISDLSSSSFMTFIISSFMTLHTSQYSLTSLSHPMCLSGGNVGVKFSKPGQIRFASLLLVDGLCILQRLNYFNVCLWKLFCVLCPACSLLSGESQHRTISLQHCPLCRHRSSHSHTRAGTSDHDTRGFMATKHVIFRLNCSKNPIHHNDKKEESEKKCWDILESECANVGKAIILPQN